MAVVVTRYRGHVGARRGRGGVVLHAGDGLVVAQPRHQLCRPSQRAQRLLRGQLRPWPASQPLDLRRVGTAIH